MASRAGRPTSEEELWAAHVRYLKGLPTSWAQARIDALVRERSNGWLSSVPLPPRSSGGVLALADRSSRRGLRLHLLQMERPELSSLPALLRALDRPRLGRLFGVSDLLEGIGAASQDRLFGELGFWHRAMVRMELPAQTRVPAAPAGFRCRGLTPADRAPFVASYVRVYDEPQGDYWLSPSPDVETDGRRFFDQFVAPDGGWSTKIVPEASLASEAGGRIVGSVVAGRTRSGAGHIFGLAVDPEHQGKGIGRSLLLEALGRIRPSVDGPVSLSVIRNSVAFRLYGSLGFREVPAPEGLLPGYWIRGLAVPARDRSPARSGR